MSTGQPPAGATENATVTTAEAIPGDEIVSVPVLAPAPATAGSARTVRSVGVTSPVTSPLSQAESEVTVTGTLDASDAERAVVAWTTSLPSSPVSVSDEGLAFRLRP